MKVNVVIAGAGRAGAELHLPAYVNLDDVVVHGICDANSDLAKKIAESNNIEHSSGALSELLQEKPIDIVSICTPPQTHFDLCSQALKNGSNVLVEKPIFMSIDEADEIHELAVKAGKSVCAVHNQKYHPGTQKAISMFRNSELGSVHQIHGVWMVNGYKNRMIADRNFWCHQLPGGRWEEMIAHPIYKAFQFLGPMKFVNLEMKRVSNRWPWLPADELEISLKGKSGFFNIKLSANTQKYNFLLIYSSNQALCVSSTMVYDLVNRDALLLPNKTFGSEKAHAALIESFIRYIKGENMEPPISWEEARNTLELTLQIGREIQRKCNA